MNNSNVLFQQFVSQITLKESTDEIQSIGYLVFEKLFGLSFTAIHTQTSVVPSVESLNTLQQVIARLNSNEPIQYILEEADFYGRKFYVNASVLIPRPETEELVSAVLHYAAQKPDLQVIDVGTGSGCIPITLALGMRDAKVTATDVSPEALAVAKTNALRLGAQVSFIEHDILNQRLPFTDIDIMVSNPPYIARHEERSMSAHVLQHEPHLALFVPDDDPLLFYKALATQAKEVLKINGMLMVEINERYGQETAQLFTQHGLRHVRILKDLSAKDRFVTGYC